MRNKFWLLLFLCLFSFFAFSTEVFASEKKPVYDAEVSPFIDKLFDARTKILVTNQTDTIKDFYIPSEKASHFALQHEMIRSKYLNTWAEKRGVKIINAIDTLRVARINKMGNTARVFLYNTLKVSYIYPDTPDQTQSFGIGTRHSLRLKKVQDKWVVAREWYLDPIEEDSNFIPSDSGGNAPAHPTYYPEESNQTVYKGNRRYNREKAVIYAIKYAGAAWGAGNNHRYNPKYRDYSYQGGDCTNFASQVIGDAKEGGGLSMGGGWHYRGGGSKAWVHTDTFKNHLLYSGYGRLIAKGTFAEVQKQTDKHPMGAMAKIQPGDLIGYELGGDVDHFSVVVGRDNHGYVLVNSHTGDRNNVPWDLGWDRTTKFLLIHIRD